MLNKLIDEHHRLQSVLERAVDAGDEAEIQGVDRKLSACHRAVVSFEPQSREDARRKFTFLLGLLYTMSEGSAYLSSIRDELVDLFDIYAG